MSSFTDWNVRLDGVIDELSQGDDQRASYLKANMQLVRRALDGIPIDKTKGAGAGYRVVVNMSSAHIPSFLKVSKYKNAYEPNENNRAGEPSKISEKRRVVDAALEVVTGVKPESLYFAAIELNGHGIGFYGDYCIVIREDIQDRELTVLDRNSYDLIREPLRTAIEGSADPEKARAKEATAISGRFGDCLSVIAAIKVLENRPPTERLFSTAMISTGILEDEDYIEVLRTRSFESADIAEIRLSPADVAVEERIRSRSIGGLPPSHAELLWRRRRRMAEASLAGASIQVRVVTTAGRSRG